MNALQNPILFPKQPANVYVADDGDVGLVIAYIGSQPSSTLTVSSLGDITFKHGVAGAEVVDTTVVPSTGIIDVSVAAYSTFGEVVDVINGSANWRAYIKDALRADATDASTGSLLVRGETTSAPKVDVPLYKDTSKVLELAIRIGIRTNTTGSEEKGAAELYTVTSLNTFGSGSSTIKIYRMNESTKEETLVYSRAGAATTVEQEKTFVVNGRGQFGVQKQGEHLLVKMDASAACTGDLQVIGAVAKGL